MSAIALSFMPLFTKDATSGIKLINEAVDRDISEQMRQHDRLRAGEKASMTTLSLIADQFKDDVAARDYLTGKSYEVVANQIRSATSRMQGQEQRDIGNQHAAAAETQAAQLKNMAMERAYRAAHLQSKALAKYEQPGQPFISPIGPQAAAQEQQLPAQQQVNTAGSMPAQGTIGQVQMGQPSAPRVQPSPQQAKGGLVAPQGQAAAQAQAPVRLSPQVSQAAAQNKRVYDSRVQSDPTFGSLPAPMRSWVSDNLLAIQGNAENVAKELPGSKDQRQFFANKLTKGLQEVFMTQHANDLREITKDGAVPLTPRLHSAATNKTVREFKEGIQEITATAQMAKKFKYTMDPGGSLQRGYVEMAQAMSDLKQEAVKRSKASGKSITVDDLIGTLSRYGDLTNKAGLVAKMKEIAPSNDPVDLAVRRLMGGQAMVANAEIHSLAGVAVKDEELDRIKQDLGFIRNESTLDNTIKNLGRKLQVIDDAAYGSAVESASKVSGNSKNPYRLVGQDVADATSKTRSVMSGRMAPRPQNSTRK